MTEQQPYEVLEEFTDFELRRYSDHLVAETEVGGPFELAGNVAFPRLARYIGGHDRSSRKLAVTAPVEQEQAPRSRRHAVGFVMPADVSAGDLPDPLDSHVHTRRVPPRQPPRCVSLSAGRAAPTRRGPNNYSPPWTVPV